MKRLLSLLLVLVLSLGTIGTVSAAPSNDYLIGEVEVNGLPADGKTIYAERGENVAVRFALEGTGDVEDVRAKAWIGGYEYEDVEDTSGIFDVEAGVTRHMSLNLQLPDDLDASETYTLHLRVFDDQNDQEAEFSLRVKESRHRIDIQKLIFRPGNTVEAGRYLRTVVRLENMGAKKEEDIYVKVSIPELGVSGEEIVDELVADENDGDDEEDSASTNEVVLKIPENARTGDYEVLVTAEYNRGHDLVSKKGIIHVDGSDQVNAIVSIDATGKSLASGEEGAYKLMFANLGDERALYSVSVDGALPWATVRVEPSFVAVEPGQTGQIALYVTPKSGVEGTQLFTATINSGANLVKELTLSADVEESGRSFEGLKSVLEIGFIVLVILLIILGLVIAFKKKGSDLEEPSEPDTDQTYY